jgi:competence protein ComEC
MPMALLALIAMPFGLEAQPLLVMGWGLDAMMAIAAFVARLPGAVILLPAFGLMPLLLIVLGGLWLLLWRGNWRFAGLLPIAAGLAAAPFAARPDIWIDREGQVIAVRLKDGSLSAPKTRKGEFSLKAWLEADGDGRAPRDVAKGVGFQCDEQSCLAMVRGRIVSHVLHPGAFADDCRRAAVLISSLPVTGPCPALRVIDAHDLWEKGAQTISFAEDSGLAGGAAPVRVETVAEGRGARPWATVRHRRELIAPAPSGPEITASSGKDGEGASAPAGLEAAFQ